MSWFKRKQKKDPVEGIPFSVSRGVPIIEVLINGRKAKLLIDTGASLNILSKELSKKYKYTVYASDKGGTVGGIGGAKQMLGISRAKIEIQGEVHRIPFKSISMKAISNKLGIVGIIGSRYLNKFDYVVDYCSMSIHRAK